MHRLPLAGLILALLAGCSQGNESGLTQGAPQERMSAADASTPSQRKTLAYEHSIEIDTPEDKVAAVHDAALAACRAASAELCDVLTSRVSSGQYVSAVLRLRAKPEGIRKIIATLGQQGEITKRSTQAEDLSGPIRDGEKKLAMLTSYREELETLRKRPGNDVDALIKVTRELASVQSELEEANGKQAVLMRRVETEILNVTIESERNQSFWKPITRAASEFGGNLARGVSTTITGVAYLLPWSLVLALVIWIGRKLWRRRKVR